MRTVIAVMVFGVVFIACAASAQSHYTLGDLILEWEEPAIDLETEETIAAGVRSFRFLSGVGGVAFGGVARSADGSAIVEISYRTEQSGVSIPDGLRLRVLTRSGQAELVEVSAELPDWLLLPIAELAESDQDACFTLFGDLQNSERAEAMRADGAYALNYHPRLANTLLGLRLFPSRHPRHRAECVSSSPTGGQVRAWGR